MVALLEETDVSGIRPIEAVAQQEAGLHTEGPGTRTLDEHLLLLPIETVIRSMLPQVIRRAESDGKNSSLSPAQKRPRRRIEKLRRRAPRQAELLEAIGNLTGPELAADLFGKLLSIIRRCEHWRNAG